MEKEKKIAIVLFVLAIVFVIIGSTFAYWSWQSSANDKTNVTFTVTSGFSCGADGGGSITSQQKSLAPTSCTNTTYAFQRTIVTNVTNSRSGSVYMDLWLDVNTIGSGLTNSQNFKYALTSQANNCTSNIIRTGTFNGITNGGKVYLLRGDEYQQTGTNTYYLFVWLDAAETSSSTQNQTFDISLGGTCIDNSPWVYTVNLYDENATNNNSVIIGQAIPNTITQYQTPAAAMAAYSNRPFYLKHFVANGIVEESYVEFVVTSAMAQANSGMTAGTYYLRGLDTYDMTNNVCKSQYLNNGNCVSPYYEANKAVLQSAFGANSGFCSGDSSDFNCGVSGLGADAYSDGYVDAIVGLEANCSVDSDGTSYCSG